MASALHNLSDYDTSTVPNGEEYKIAIVVAEWNKEITFALHRGCVDVLIEHGCKKENIATKLVPGTFELTYGAQLAIQKQKPDAVICLGCVIKGETSHNEYINHAVAQGFTNLSLQTGIPVIFGVLTPNTEQQAKDRAGGIHGNKGVEAAITALKMVALKQQ